MTAKITPEVSHHLRLLTLISAIFVVFIHATTIKYDGSLGRLSPIGRLQSYLSYYILHVALPIFFLNAAFFFSLNVQTLKDVLVGIKRRSITLLMPYLAWSAVGCIFAMAFGFTQDLSLGQLIVTWAFNPPPSHLWFLRDLICLLLLTPLIYLLPRKVLAFISVLAWTWWMYFQTPVVIDTRSQWYEVISNEALCWFLLGAFGTHYADYVTEWIRKGLSIYSLVFLFGLWVLGLKIPLPAYIPQGISITAGVLFFLGAAQYMHRLSALSWTHFFTSYSFLIYLAHHPILGFFQKALVQLNLGDQIWHLCVYLLAPVIIVAFLILLFSTLSIIVPKIVFIANGGRALPSVFKFAKNKNEIS